MIVKIKKNAGEFAEDKDIAAAPRKDYIVEGLELKSPITIDFTGVRLTTQSFIHALIADPLRRYGEDALGRIKFKGCSKLVRGIVETVVQYSLETLDDE